MSRSSGRRGAERPRREAGDSGLGAPFSRAAPLVHGKRLRSSGVPHHQTQVLYSCHSQAVDRFDAEAAPAVVDGGGRQQIVETMCHRGNDAQGVQIYQSHWRVDVSRRRLPLILAMDIVLLFLSGEPTAC